MTLYTDLMNLVEKSEAFYYKDFPLENAEPFTYSTYRIFNYRLCSYSDFLEPGALECRGIMFDITDEPCLVSRPMEKFFNLHENPFTMDLDLSTVVNAELKADGSLISTYLHKGEVRLKSKGSLESDQALDAMAFLEHNDNKKFKDELHLIAVLGNTVNMEWCAPDNRVVIAYMEPQLTVLNIRGNDEGAYVDLARLARHAHPTFSETAKRWVNHLVLADGVTWPEFVAGIPTIEGIEGYVVLLESGQRIKIKTEWYLVQHRAKDSINSPRRLFETVLEEATDDLRSLFHDDPLVILQIEEMEQRVDKIYNHTVDQVERFYERNKGLERKDYAILGQKELDRKIFGLAMSKYIGKDVNYKEFLKKHYRDFGITDGVNDE